MRHPQARNNWRNSPAALRRRKAAADAARENLARTLPPVDYGPAPGELEVVIELRTRDGEVLHRLEVFAPVSRARCDQHAGRLDGVELATLLTATAAGRMLAGWVSPRPSIERLACNGDFGYV